MSRHRVHMDMIIRYWLCGFVCMRVFVSVSLSVCVCVCVELLLRRNALSSCQFDIVGDNLKSVPMGDDDVGDTIENGVTPNWLMRITSLPDKSSPPRLLFN